MSDRTDALQRLHRTLTAQQIADLQLVINTADVQGDYHRAEIEGLLCDGSIWEDDIQQTLWHLSREFKPPEGD